MTQTLNILLVEDHEDSAALMARLLEGLGHKVTTCATVREATDLALAEPFDLLLCDLGLPDGSGNDVVRAVLPKRPIRAIAVTGFSDFTHVEAARRAGFSHFMTKPISIIALQKLLLEVAAFLRAERSATSWHDGDGHGDGDGDGHPAL